MRINDENVIALDIKKKLILKVMLVIRMRLKLISKEYY